MNELTDFGAFFTPGLIVAIVSMAVVQLLLMVAALVSLLRKKAPTGDMVLWLLLIVLVNFIGPILYFAIGQSKLDEKIAQMEDGEAR